MAQAKKQFTKIKDVAGREFQCLVYYGMGKVLFKENRYEYPKNTYKLIDFIYRTNNLLPEHFLNCILLDRFSEALDEFNKALLMVQRQIVPGKLTWPTTTITVQETYTDYLKVTQYFRC